MWNQRANAEEGDREDEGDHNTPGAERLKETHLLQELTRNLKFDVANVFG